MTKNEALMFFNRLREEGMKDEDILGTLYLMYQDNAIDIKQLEEFTILLGYEFTDEFANMSPEDQKTKGLVDKKADNGPDVRYVLEMSPTQIVYYYFKKDENRWYGAVVRNGAIIQIIDYKMFDEKQLVKYLQTHYAKYNLRKADNKDKQNAAKVIKQ